jgi:hypothetical protein
MILTTSILFFVVEVLIVSNLEPDWKSIKNKTIGTISRISLGKPSGVWISYNSKGKLCKEFDGLDKNDLIVGEKYWIKYCTSCSNKFTSKIKSIPYLPVFTEDESYFETSAKILKINELNFFSGTESYPEVEFFYFVGKEKFEKHQSLPLDFMKKYPNLKTGQVYNVKVWVKDYRRAIIDLSKVKNKNAS